MFKVLITTTYWASPGASVHTVVAEFDTIEAADVAIRLINNAIKDTRTGSSRSAVALF